MRWWHGWCVHSFEGDLILRFASAVQRHKALSPGECHQLVGILHLRKLVDILPDVVQSVGRDLQLLKALNESSIQLVLVLVGDRELRDAVLT